MQRTLEMFHDEVVVGADLSALAYAYKNKSLLIFTRKILPYKYSIKNNYEKDLNRYINLMYRLCILSLSPFGDKVQTIRLEDDNTLKVITHSSFIITVKFNKLVISDDFNLEGLPEKTGKSSYDNHVIDYYYADRRYPFKDCLETNDRVAYRVLRTSIRYRKNYDMRLIVVSSLLTDTELNDPEYSGSFIRLRIVRLYGRLTKFIHEDRKVFPLGKNLYNFPNNISILLDEADKFIPNPDDETLIERLLWKKM